MALAPDPAATARGTGGRVAGLLGGGVDRVLDELVAPGFSEIGLAVRSRLPGWPDDPAPDALDGHHVAVTGASSGIGAATAAQLARLGAHVHLLVRNPDKAVPVAQALAGPSTIWTCDVGDLDSVAALTDELELAGVPLSALVHNAGVMPPEREVSAQGHELSLAVHVLGPTLMTQRLMPLLTSARRPGRVILVTSGGMYAQDLRLDDLGYREAPYRPATAYARSKRAQVELLAPLQARWPAVVVAGMHPGWAATPGVTSSLPGFARLTGPVLRDPDGGADTITWLAATADPLPGGRLWHDRRPRPTTKLGRNGATPAERKTLAEWVFEAIAPWLDS